MDKTTERTGALIESRLMVALMWLLSLLLLSPPVPALASAASGAFDLKGWYFFAATGYNAGGLETIDYSMVQSAEPTPEALTVTPASDLTPNSGIVPISVSTPERFGITRIQFLVNGAPVAESESSPLRFSWNTSLLAGDYTVSVKAFDTAGNEATSDDLTVTVSGDNKAPRITWLGPAQGATVSGSVVISASSTDDIGVTAMELYLDGLLVSQNNQEALNHTWDSTSVANGSHVLTAVAYDASGNSGTSAPVTLIVLNDRTAPVVSSVAPAANSSATGVLQLSAQASDDVAVIKVEFYLDGALKGTVTGAPYTLNWNSTTVANGSHTLSAKAYDAAGNVGVSGGVTLTIGNDWTPPTVTAFALPAIATSSTVAVSRFACSDNVGGTGFLITESAAAPAPSDPRWSVSVPASFTFSGSGHSTAYAWARDAAGRVSAGRAASVLIDTVLPMISSLSLATGNSSVTIKASGSDNVAVAKMELYVDNVVQMQTFSNSFTFVWNSGLQKSQTITIKVHDTAGNVRSQSFRVAKI